jgi:spore coat protein A
MSRTQAGGVPVNLHRLTADWGEGSSNAGGQEGGGESAATGDATWRYRFWQTLQWSSQGGDYVAGSSASTSVAGNGFYSWSSAGMVNDVQSWVTNPVTNFGWIVRGGESGQKTAKRFNSRQNNTASQRPKLTVNYTPPAVTGACCSPGQVCEVVTAADCANQGGTFQGNGTDCIPNPCPPDPMGACCGTSTPWACTFVTENACLGSGGTYQGDGTQCTAIEDPDVGGCPVVLTPFQDALPVPALAQPVTGSPGGAATYHVVMQEFQQQLHQDLPPTTVWGFGTSPNPFDPSDPADTSMTYATYPGPTFLATRGQPVTVRYFNQLRDTSLGGTPPPYRTDHYLPVPGTMPMDCIHGAEDNAKAVVHLHGGRVEQQFDGYPEHTFLPGQEAANCVTDDPPVPCTSDSQCSTPGTCDGDGAPCVNDAGCVGHGGAQNCRLCEPGYHYPNDQLPSLIWYHDHALGITRLNVYMGMAGGYLITDAFEQGLGLPSGAYEAPLIIQDKAFRAVSPLGGLRYHHGEWVEHFYGDAALVNGKVWPVHDVERGKYRFRLLNGSNSRNWVLSLDRLGVGGIQDLPFHVLGGEGGLLPAPVTVNTLTMGPGERYDVVVDFAALPAGTEIVLTNSSVIAGAPELPQVMKFVVLSQPGAFTNPLPTSLRPMEALDPAQVVRTRQFLLRKGTDACTGQRWEIQTKDPNGVPVGSRWHDITEFPQMGSTEIWEFVNPTVVPHPMHLHLVFFQILNRQGFEIVNDQVVPLGMPTPPAPEEAGWKDTARTEPGQILRVLVRFEGYTGLYPYHCHILEHEDHEMMRQFWLIDPVEIVASATQLSWTALPGATGYDVVRGDLNTLRATDGNFAAATMACLQNGQPTTSISHAAGSPGPGQGIWYLSRTRDAVGMGTYDSGQTSQVGLRDQEIAASGVDCQ